MTKMLKTIPMSDILPNLWRDFTLYPIDQEQVDRLASSIDETGFWLGLQARKHPSQSGKYQLAAGHHRKAAAEKLNFTALDIDIVDFDDAMMLKIMTVENATQRGHSSAAILDSVASCVKFIASGLFGGERWGAGEFTSREIGREEILGQVPSGSLTENEIKLAIATLKDSGRYAQIISEAVEKEQLAAQHRLEEIERRRLQEEQTERLRAEQAARKEAEARARAESATDARKKAEAEQDAKRKAAERAAEKKAANAAEQKAAADRARAELEAKREHESREKAELKRQKDEEAAKVKEAKAAEKARATEKAEEEKRIAKARAIADKAEEKGITFDASVAQLFQNDHQLDTFRKAVIDPIHCQYIRVDQQKQVAEQIIAEAKKNGRDELSSAFIRECVANVVRSGRGEVKKAEDEHAKLIAGKRLIVALDEVKKGRRYVWAGVTAAVKELDAGASIPQTFDLYLTELENSLTKAVADLRKAAGIKIGSNVIEGSMRHATPPLMIEGN